MEIKNKKQLNFILESEKQLYLNKDGKIKFLFKKVKREPIYYSWKYVATMRKANFYYGIRRNSIFSAIMYLYYIRKMNAIGRKNGIECGEHVFDEGLKIFHTQGIVINGNCKIGTNCRLYGNNCIGNDGISPECPTVGDNVKICVGAKILGNVEIADGVVVAAGAVVVNSCNEKNAILAGIPAKIIGYTDKTFLS